MSIAEMIIYYILFGNAGMAHITPDGKKLYFLLGRKLICLEAEHGTDFNLTNRDHHNRLMEDYILEHKEFN
jgi:hypothetical protein